MKGNQSGQAAVAEKAHRCIFFGAKWSPKVGEIEFFSPSESKHGAEGVEDTAVRSVGSAQGLLVGRNLELQGWRSDQIDLRSWQPRPSGKYMGM